MFRDFQDNREAAVTRAAAYYSVLPESVLANVRQLEATRPPTPALSPSSIPSSAFGRTDLLLRDLRQRAELEIEKARIRDIGGGGHATRAAWRCVAADVRGLEINERRAAFGRQVLEI